MNCEGEDIFASTEESVTSHHRWQKEMRAKAEIGNSYFSLFW